MQLPECHLCEFSIDELYPIKTCKGDKCGERYCKNHGSGGYCLWCWPLFVPERTREKYGEDANEKKELEEQKRKRKEATKKKQRKLEDFFQKKTKQ